MVWPEAPVVAFGSKLGRIALFALRWLAAALLLVVVARAVYYPFWAADASRAELERSWGGPSAVGATLAHWLAAALIGGSCLVVIVVSRRASHRIKAGTAPDAR